MRKLIFIILILALLGGGGYFAYTKFFSADAELQPEEEVSTPLSEVEEDEEESEPEDELEIVPEDEEPVEEETTEEETTEEGPAETKRLIPSLTGVQIYDGAFVKYSYPANMSIQNETLNGMELATDGETIATLDIYTNTENLPPAEFVESRDNVNNYFADATKNNIDPEEIFSGSNFKAIKFPSMPGFVVQDIYLVPLDGLMIVVGVRDQQQAVFETTILSLEKSN